MPDQAVIISDVHGCFYTMLRLLNACPKGARLYLNGDLIDRGPYSRKVVEFAIQNAIPTVAGNHEDLALAFYNRKAHCANMYERGIWLDNGGDKAVRDWKVIDKRVLTGPQIAQAESIGGRVPDDVLEWMERLPAYIAPDDLPLDSNNRRLLVSHTGYGFEADDGDWFQALWGRHSCGDGAFAVDPMGEARDDGYHRVFGHTPAKRVESGEGWTMIDTGAAYGKRGYGRLTAFIWPTHETITIPYDETPIGPAFMIGPDGCIE